MNDTIANALARANEVAAQAPAPVVQAPAAYAPAAAPVARPRSLTDALDSAGTSVDEFIKVKEDGFLVGKDKAKYDTIDVEITPSQLKFGYGIRYDVGGTVTYAKSYNGVTDARSGRSWADLVAQAMRQDPKCSGQYDLVEIPMELTEDLKRKEGDDLPAGTVLGYTTSITGYKPFMAWLNGAVSKYGADAAIPVKLSVKMRKYKGGEHPLMAFDTIGD